MSNSTEEYLEALYTLTQGGKTASTSEIAKRLNVRPASVTEMLGKLAEIGHINYSPYQGVTLTPQGFRIAERMTRKHRLLERFLHDVLKLGKDKVHDEACGMEHALSDEAARAMCRTMKYPDTCPDDGQTIPPCDFRFSSCDECSECGDLDKVGRRETSVVSLTAMKERDAATIAFIRGDNKVLRRLLDLGLTPGTRVKVVRIAPMKGPVEVAVRGSRLALGGEVASNIFVETGATTKGGK